jgi:hypothetical protein
MPEESKKVSWNASQGIINEISNRRTAANTFFIAGDIRKAFNTLVSIKQSVIQSFKEDERKKLKVVENRFSQLSYILSPSFSNSFNKEWIKIGIKARGFASIIYSEYNDLLMDLLEDRGYLVGEQADSSRMRF